MAEERLMGAQVGGRIAGWNVERMGMNFRVEDERRRREEEGEAGKQKRREERRRGLGRTR